MNDAECTAFLQWALPRLHLRWRGFRNVRGQVCKRLRRRIATLGLDDLEAYRAYLAKRSEEWSQLDSLCRITISRFWRDRWVWRALADDVLPSIAARAAARGRGVSAWSTACGAGEEPYSLVLAWALEVEPRVTSLELAILATDADPRQLLRARRACYPSAALRELPAAWRTIAFEARAGECCLRERFRAAVNFAVHDLRDPPPPGPFDLILCRNLAFTYFDDALQLRVADQLSAALEPGGILVLGGHEELPRAASGWTEHSRNIFERTGDR